VVSGTDGRHLVRLWDLFLFTGGEVVPIEIDVSLAEAGRFVVGRTGAVPT